MCDWGPQPQPALAPSQRLPSECPEHGQGHSGGMRSACDRPRRVLSTRPFSGACAICWLGQVDSRWYRACCWDLLGGRPWLVVGTGPSQSQEISRFVAFEQRLSIASLPFRLRGGATCEMQVCTCGGGCAAYARKSQDAASRAPIVVLLRW